MKSDLLNFCLQNKIRSITVSKNFEKYSISQNFLGHLKVVELDKDLLQTRPIDFEYTQLIWLECSPELKKNFSQVIEHVLNMGVTWIWISSLRFSDYLESNNGYNPKRQYEAVISFEEMIQIMEKSMYSIHRSISTYEDSVKCLLLKKY
jgi:hypothetical protein